MGYGEEEILADRNKSRGGSETGHRVRTQGGGSSSLHRKQREQQGIGYGTRRLLGRDTAVLSSEGLLVVLEHLLVDQLPVMFEQILLALVVDYSGSEGVAQHVDRGTDTVTEEGIL